MLGIICQFHHSVTELIAIWYYIDHISYTQQQFYFSQQRHMSASWKTPAKPCNALPLPTVMTDVKHLEMSDFMDHSGDQIQVDNVEG